MRNNQLFIFFLSLIILASCNTSVKDNDENNSENTTQPSYSLNQVWATESVLMKPESVAFDDENDMLYVSNINGETTAKDNNGFISSLNTQGEIKNLHWVDGLNAPKGMAVHDGKLYVTDIDQLVIIDIAGASIEKKIDVENAKFLNDVAVDKNGDVYFSDSEGKIIYRYKNGETEAWINEGLDRPNGLLVEDGRVLLASSGSGEFLSIDKNSMSRETIASGIGHGDGLTSTGINNTYLVSDWSGEVFLITDNNKISLLDTKEKNINSADIEFIPSQKLLLVPTFNDNRVVAYKLTEEHD